MNEKGKLTNGDVPENLWRDLRAKYIKSDISYAQLSEDFGVSFHTIARRAKAEDWKAERAKHREANLRKQRAALMRAKLESAEEDAVVRVRYARFGREISETAMERLRALRDSGSVNSGVVVQIAATVRRGQEIEFIARGIPADIGKVQHEVYGSWNEYLEKVRKERGLPDRPNPFVTDTE